MDDDEAREMMEKVVAEREEDAAELRRAGNKALREQRERIRAAQGLVEKAQAMGEPDLVLVFREVDYSEWRDTFPAERWATGYPGAESTKYYRLRKDAPVEAPAVSTIGAEFARGWNGGLGDTTKTKRLIDAAITLRESLPLYWHGPQETEFDEALDDWKSSRVEPPKVCAYCKDPLGGGPGGWYSLETKYEVCPSGESPTSFHEPPDGDR